MYTLLSQKGAKYIPDFDSSSSMLFSLGNYLADVEEAVGFPPRIPQAVGDAINKIPRSMLKLFFRFGGALESISLKQLAKVDDKAISSWIIGAYPEKKYPAVMIGSPNGALIHVCAMLGIPWIPQTILLAPARGMGADELIADAEWGRRPAAIMKRTLPYFRAHQMHDPIHDRVMVTGMGYFRVKRLELGPYIEKFLKKCLMPGAAIFIADCSYLWPSLKVSKNHYFQVGGLGDVGGYEYLRGSEAVGKFLRSQGSKLRRWEVPEGQVDIPEAEWGYANELSASINSFARRNGYRQSRIRFNHPDDVSPFCADLTKSWYNQNGIYDDRLLIECFAFMAPWWAARTGSIPYWLSFNTSTSMKACKKYLGGKAKFDEMYAMIMPNAVESVGLVSIAEWKRLMRNNAKKIAFIGTDEKIYPFDMGTFIKYFKDLQEKIKARHFMPRYMEIAELSRFVSKNKARYNISFADVK